MKSALDDERISVLRQRLVRMHFESGVGHIGGNLSCLDALALLFNEYLQEDDRFVLSKGHSAGALYVALWSVGKISETDLATFHQDNTLLAGHPPANSIEEILFATGSLGHGLSLAAGTALARRFKSSGGHTYCLTSDGEWQEGSTWEALIFAAHHRLANLTILIDHNGLQGFGSTAEVASMFPLHQRLQGFDIYIQVIPGHDLASIRAALDAPADRPRVILLNTIKGKGVSFMENRMEWHYLPLKDADYQQALRELSGE